MEQLTFKNRVQYAKYLREALTHTLEPDSFNIFLHCVTTATPHSLKPLPEKEDVLGRVNGILTEGLNLEGSQERCPYGSINGTARFMGEYQGIKIDDIIDYNFLCNSRYVNTIILAIPKYIGTAPERLEFSSYRGKMREVNRFKKACLLDISKERYLPTEFTFGYQVVDRKTETIKFWQNHRHFSLLTTEEQNKLMKGFSDRIASVMDYCQRQHKAESLDEVLDIMTHRHMAMLDDYYNEV